MNIVLLLIEKFDVADLVETLLQNNYLLGSKKIMLYSLSKK